MICNHERNLDDDQIRALGSVGGVMGLVSYSVFVGDSSDLEQLYLEHIKRAVSILGIDSVSVSSDDMDFLKVLFNEDLGDNIFKYSEIKSKMINLLKKEFSDEEINKILYLNAKEKLFN